MGLLMRTTQKMNYNAKRLKAIELIAQTEEADRWYSVITLQNPLRTADKLEKEVEVWWECL
jgi:hypothetical protein